MSRVILVTRNGFQVQFPEVCFVHCLQFSRRRQEAGALGFQLSFFPQHSKFNGEPIDA